MLTIISALFIALSSFGQTPPLHLKGQRWLDQKDRQVTLRGFNVSGSSKLKENGFKPFKNDLDAKKTFSLMAKKTGANVTRFLIAWEGVHPAVDTLDYAYLMAITEQIKAALNEKIFVILDFHQDLFSRHLFTADSCHTGNGAPLWATPFYKGKKEYCGLFCFHWSQHNLTDHAVKYAFSAFWFNDFIATTHGPRGIQDEYLWQLKYSVKFILDQLAPYQRPYFLGVDPFNEPVDGYRRGLSQKSWEELKLAPFYGRVRHALDQVGASDLFIFAEPLVFWNVSIPPLIKGSGKINFKKLPHKTVLAPHFYDAKRQGPLVFKKAQNFQYSKDFYLLRHESKRLRRPLFLGEFGTPFKAKGVGQSDLVLTALYQGLDTAASRKLKDRFTRAPWSEDILSGSLWHWDYYYDHHHEYQNDNRKLLKEKADAWNGEDFSVVKNFSSKYRYPESLIARAWPKSINGRLRSFAYQDADKLAFGLWSPKQKAPYFIHQKWLWFVWKAQGPGESEMFWPKHFNSKNVSFITNALVTKKNKHLIIKNQSRGLYYFLAVSKKLNTYQKKYIQDEITQQLSSSLNPLVLIR